MNELFDDLGDKMCSLRSAEDYWCQFELEVQDDARHLSGKSMHEKDRKGRARIRRRATKYVLWKRRLFRRVRKTLVIVIDKKDRQDKMKALQDELGNWDVRPTVALDSARFWPGVHTDVSNYVKTCDVCQRITGIPRYLTTMEIPRKILFDVF